MGTPYRQWSLALHWRSLGDKAGTRQLMFLSRWKIEELQNRNSRFCPSANNLDSKTTFSDDFPGTAALRNSATVCATNWKCFLYSKCEHVSLDTVISFCMEFNTFCSFSLYARIVCNLTSLCRPSSQSGSASARECVGLSWATVSQVSDSLLGKNTSLWRYSSLKSCRLLWIKSWRSRQQRAKVAKSRGSTAFSTLCKISGGDAIKDII